MISPGEPESTIVQSLIAANAPPYITAALQALQFRAASPLQPIHLSDDDWQRLLSWCDGRQLTLMLPHVCGPGLPDDIRHNIAQRSARYGIRFERLKRDLFEIIDVLDTAHLDFVLLKGLSHAPSLTPDARLRAQGDIDLWLIGSSVYEAQEVLHNLGYSSLEASKARHLNPLARPHNWKWRGDLFDSSMPISVELHYELWSKEMEYVEAEGIEAFWERRVPRDFDGHRVNVLRDEDMFGFAALHLLMHLLHGDLPLQRAWEIAHFLNARADDVLFWESWRSLHSPKLRQLEATVCELVTRWFHSRRPQLLDTEILHLPEPTKFWLETYYLSPLVSQWAPNKREVWLNLALIDSWPNKVRVLTRRLFPLSLRASVPQAENKTLRYALARFKAALLRSFHHARALLPTIFDGLRFALLRRL
jgi:hypothetical protein